MAFTNEAVKASYQGNGSNDTFAIPGQAIVSINSETKVYTRDESDDPPTPALQVEGSDYNIVGTNVVFESGSIPSADEKVVVIRQLPLTQVLDLIGNGAFNADNVELALDRVVAMIQQLNEKLSRVPMAGITEQQSEASMQLPEGAENPNTLLGFDADGDLTTTTLSDLDVDTQLASQSDAETGTENTKYMSPLRTRQSILVNAKGDLLTHNATVAQRIAIGSDYHRLMALSAETAGLKWAGHHLRYLASSTTPLTGSLDHDLVNIDASGGAKTYNPPTASTSTSKILTVRKNDSSFNAITITGVTTVNTEGESVTLISTGSSWIVINRHIPSVWTAFTPTGAWSTNTTYTGFWRRVGENLEQIVHLALAGAPTSATLIINLVSGLTLEAAKIVATTFLDPSISPVVFRDDTGVTYYGALNVNSTTSVGVFTLDDTAAGLSRNAVVNATQPVTWAASDSIDIKFSVPIVGWNG